MLVRCVYIDQGVVFNVIGVIDDSYCLAYPDIIVASDTAMIGWIYNYTTKALTPPPINYDALRDTALASIREASLLHQALTTVSGAEYATDKASLGRLAAFIAAREYALAAELEIEDATQSYPLANGASQSKTLTQLKALNYALCARIEACVAVEGTATAGVLIGYLNLDAPAIIAASTGITWPS